MESRVPHHIPGVSSSIMVQPLLDSHVPYGRLQHPLAIYPIHQMKSSHVENDYIDSPTAIVCQQPHAQPKHLAASRQTDAHHHHHHQQHHHQHQQHHHHHHSNTHTQDSTHPWISFSGRPSSISSSSSTSSDQRLLDHAAPTPVLDSASTTTTTTTTASSVSTSSSSSSSSLPPAAAASLGRVPGSTGGLQAKLLSAKPADLKTAGSALNGPVGSLLPAEAKHLLLCERCGKCRCTECTLPRALPSCWVCHQACLCSAQSLVDAATCMCLVKGVFYHCAEDEDGEEGSCADRPCSCGPAHRCTRWSFMAALSLALPCLLCYLPAVGCAKLSQKCYDRAQRPGCRCKAPAAAKAGVAGILGKTGVGLDKQAS